MKNKLDHIDAIFSQIRERETEKILLEKGWSGLRYKLLYSELLSFNFVNVKSKYIYLLIFVLFSTLTPTAFLIFSNVQKVNLSNTNQSENLNQLKKSNATFIYQNSNVHKYEMPISDKKILSVNNIAIDRAEQIEITKPKNINIQKDIVRNKLIEVTKIAPNRDINLRTFDSVQIINNYNFEKYNDNKYWINSYSRFSISIEVGYNFSMEQITSNSYYDNFKNYRINNESPIITPTYGLRFNYQYKNWVFSSGLDYVTVGEEINYGINEIVIDPDGGYYDIDTLTLYIVGTDNNLIPMIIGYEKTWVDEYKELNYEVNNYNKYSYIEIPVTVGYKYSRQRFSVTTILGVSFGYLYHASGKIPINQPNSFVDLNKNSRYLNRTVSNLNLALSFEYSLTPNYGIYVKTDYKQSLNSAFKEYPLTVKYRNVGVKIGINIYL